MHVTLPGGRRTELGRLVVLSGFALLPPAFISYVLYDKYYLKTERAPRWIIIPPASEEAKREEKGKWSAEGVKLKPWLSQKQIDEAAAKAAQATPRDSPCSTAGEGSR